jgi:hypothetical protein
LPAAANPGSGADRHDLGHSNGSRGRGCCDRESDRASHRHERHPYDPDRQRRHYTLTNLPVGAYDLTAEAAGFKVVKAANVTLTVGETLTMNLTMQVGTVSQTVEVSASAVAPVELESTQLSNIIEWPTTALIPVI